jgi:hypothetical protein
MRTNLLLSLLLTASMSQFLGACNQTTSSTVERGTSDEESALVGGDEFEDGGGGLVELDVEKEGASEGVTVLTSAAEYQAFFGRAAGPSVDFSKQWVVHFSVGERPTGGYRAAVTAVAVGGPPWLRAMVITTLETEPAPWCDAAPGATRPQAAVRIARPWGVAAAWHLPARAWGACGGGGGGDSFCARVRCVAGTECDEATRSCEPVDPNELFCARVRCASGTVCNEGTRSCEPAEPGGPFCPTVLCAPGMVCNEAARSCEPAGPPEPFCPTALCAPGTTCNEATNACEPVEPAPCVVTGCSGQVCAGAPVATTCEWRPEYGCFAAFGACERDGAGACGWRATAELDGCLASFAGE